MAQLIQVAIERDMPDKRGACIIAGMTVSQEAGVQDNDPPHERRFWCPANHADEESFQYQHDSVSDDNRSVGYFQQQKGPQDQLWWGPTEQEMRLHDAAANFMGRLQRIPYDASTPQSANDAAQAIQQSGVPQAYAQWFDDINRLYDKVSGTITPPWIGDPVWLKDVIAAEGVDTAETDDWLHRGHGDFAGIWGVVIHHTGGDNTPVSEISHHPVLGLASQIHLAKDGLATMCGVGVAWHAGVGCYPGIPDDGANQVTIGIENVNLPPRDAPHRTGWDDVQYDAMVKTVSAILRKLGHDSSRVISHKEWAGAKQGKWDPGSIDMNIFRADVQQRLSGVVLPPAPPPADEFHPDLEELCAAIGSQFTA